MSGTTRWDHVKALFHQALERAPADRAMFLRQACAGDREMEADVESLLPRTNKPGVSRTDLRSVRSMTRPSPPWRASWRRATASDPTRSWRRSAPAGWARSTRRATRGWTGRSRSKCCRASIHDPQARERFEREARAMASLNHPHICTLHDIGHEEGTGRTHGRLPGHGIPGGRDAGVALVQGRCRLSSALELAIQIASALDSAHRAGIVHRDLKPANVMLTAADRSRHGPPDAKLLDFGLAKVSSAARVTGNAKNTSANTVSGPHTIVGTLPYMAPEQLAGKRADPRTDIFAFGALLYEMVTGRRAFNGESDATLVVVILHNQPASTIELQPATPPLLDHLVQRCLSKDPDVRWQSAHDLAMELRWIASVGTTRSAAAPRGRSSRPLWIVSMITLFIAAGLLGWLIHRPPADTAPTVRFSIVPPESTTLVRDETPAVSPDGGHVVFVASSGDRRSQLWVRSVDGLVTRALSGNRRRSLAILVSRQRVDRLLRRRTVEAHFRGRWDCPNPVRNTRDDELRRRLESQRDDHLQCGWGLGSLSRVGGGRHCETS